MAGVLMAKSVTRKNTASIISIEKKLAPSVFGGMPSKKSHARAAGKRAFSIALPEELIEEIQGIARDQDRSRNGQIEHFLKNSVAEWKREHAKPKIKALEDPAHVSPRKKIK